MPAAVLENTPQEAFGRNLANRRCSERQRSQQVASPAAGKVKRKAGSFGQTRNGKTGTADAEKRSRNRQAGRERSSDRNQPPDGTGRRRGGRAMKAGSFGNHRDADPGRLQAAMPADAQGKANGMAIAQNRPGTCRRSWGRRRRWPHLLLGKRLAGRFGGTMRLRLAAES